MRQTKQELQQKLERALKEETRLRNQIEQREQEYQKLSKSYEEMLSYKNRVIKELRHSCAKGYMKGDEHEIGLKRS
jgi:predicted nuclease with TOPRIM domain